MIRNLASYTSRTDNELRLLAGKFEAQATRARKTSGRRARDEAVMYEHELDLVLEEIARRREEARK